MAFHTMFYLFLLLKSFKLEAKFINIQQDTLTITDLIHVVQILKDGTYKSLLFIIFGICIFGVFPLWTNCEDNLRVGWDIGRDPFNQNFGKF